MLLAGAVVATVGCAPGMAGATSGAHFDSVSAEVARPSSSDGWQVGPSLVVAFDEQGVGSATVALELSGTRQIDAACPIVETTSVYETGSISTPDGSISERVRSSSTVLVDSQFDPTASSTDPYDPASSTSTANGRIAGTLTMGSDLSTICGGAVPRSYTVTFSGLALTDTTNNGVAYQAFDPSYTDSESFSCASDVCERVNADGSGQATVTGTLVPSTIG